MIKSKISVLHFTKNGNVILQKIIPLFNTITIYDKNVTTAKQFVQNAFYESDVLVFIGAIGIAVRLIAPFITAKDKDPAVIVIDELGENVIPILSGHIGGANEFSTILAKKLKAKEIITTATDINNKIAIDYWAYKNDCIIDDISKIKYISASVLNDELVGFYSDFSLDGKLPKEFTFNSQPKGVVISLSNKKKFDITLNIIPKIVVVGVGCKKNTTTKDFEDFVIYTLKNNNISLKAIFSLASINLKKNQECILNFCNKYNIPFKTFSKEQLETVQCVSFESPFVKSVTGVGNVCERSAIYVSGNNNVILPKTCHNGMTISIATKDWKCKF